MKYQRKQTKQAETTNLPKTKDKQSSQSGNSKDIQALSESFGLITKITKILINHLVIYTI